MKYRIMDVLVNSFIVLVFGFLPILAILMAGCILSDNADMPIASIFGAWATLAVLVPACLLVIAYAILDCLKPKKEHEYVATADLSCVRFKDGCEWHESALLLTEDEIIVASAKKGDQYVLNELRGYREELQLTQKKLEEAEQKLKSRSGDKVIAVDQFLHIFQLSILVGLCLGGVLK